MASAHNFFFSQDSETQTLHRRIVPNEEQQQRQQERWNDLREWLVGDLTEVSGYPIHTWLQGSYKFGTQTRPARKDKEFDIDLGVYFKWSGAPTDASLTPRAFKALVQDSLKRYSDEAGDDVLGVVEPAKEKCARIRFEGGFHLDVPAYHLDEERDARALATERDVWEYTDPKALYLWFRENFAEEESSQVRRLIRYVKMWAALRLKEPPSSVMLTVLLAEAYLQLSGVDRAGDDEILRAAIAGVIERLAQDPSVPNPVDPLEDLNRLSEGAYEDFCRELPVLRGIADRALEAKTEFDAVTIWAEAFDHFFPAPIKSTEQFNRALVPVQFVPKIKVRAVPVDNKNHTYEGTNRIGPIPKKCKITFRLENAAQLPVGAHVRWIVRNEGNEAEVTNDLGHLAGKHPYEAEEKSAYRGSHHMDVTVSSATHQIIGFTRVPVEVLGIAMPPRNPRKPGYTRFRRRR